MTSPVSRRTSLLTSKEGQRTQVPEGGELVCYRNKDDQQLFLKVEYSRETMVKLSSSIFCHQRPSGLKQIAEDMPELLGLPHPIPVTAPALHLETSPHCPQNQLNSGYYEHFSCHLFSPFRGPVTEADEESRNVSNQRELQRRLQQMTSRGELTPSEFSVDDFETPAMCNIRNPQFT